LDTNQSIASPSGIHASSVMLQPGNGQLSPFAKLLSTLQQLLPQSDLTKYVQVIQPIATNLQTPPKLPSQSFTTAANQLNQLDSAFTNASKDGQRPNIQDLAQAVGGHHHHVQAASADSDGDSSGKSSSSSAASSSGWSGPSQVSQLFSLPRRTDLRMKP
jgi:hypothetical protein